jgi:hypothetical protein
VRPPTLLTSSSCCGPALVGSHIELRLTCVVAAGSPDPLHLQLACGTPQAPRRGTGAAACTRLSLLVPHAPQGRHGATAPSSAPWSGGFFIPSGEVLLVLQGPPCVGAARLPGLCCLRHAADFATLCLRRRVAFFTTGGGMLCYVRRRVLLLAVPDVASLGRWSCCNFGRRCCRLKARSPADVLGFATYE